MFQFRIFMKLDIIQHIGPSVLNVMFQHALSSLLRRLHNLCLKSLVTRILCEVAISYDFLPHFSLQLTMNSRHNPTVLSVTLSFFFFPWRSPVDTPTWTIMGNHICNVLYLRENPSDQPNSSLIIISIYNDMLCLHRQTWVLT